MIDKIPYTPGMRELLEMSKAEAGRLGHDYIGPEHYLMALLRKGDGLAIEALVNMNVDLEKVKMELDERCKPGSHPMVGLFSPSKEAKQVLESSKKIAKSMKYGWVGTEVLLLALIREESTIASECLRDLGVEYERVEREVINVIEGSPPRIRESKKREKILDNVTASSNPAPLISVCFDETEFTEEDIEIFLSYVAETYRSVSGVGLKVVKGHTLTPEDAEIYA